MFQQTLAEASSIFEGNNVFLDGDPSFLSRLLSFLSLTAYVGCGDVKE